MARGTPLGRRAVAAIATLLMAMAVLVPLASPASAGPPIPEPPDPLPPPAEGGIHPLIFPVVGANHYLDTFGACRSGCTRAHHGVDIMTYGVKGVPVVAAAAGTVYWAFNEQGGRCCAMGIRTDDGWETRYIHLNNDTPGTDDGLGWGFADGIDVGVHVEAGQLIAFVGDSGNAENVGPHLHFELHTPDGTPINPTPHVDAALVISEPGIVNDEPPCPEGAECDVAVMVDSGGQWHVRERLAWAAPIDSFFFGNPGDVPFMGDWDCDGVATPGLYRQSDGFVYLRNSNTQGVADVEFFFGNPGDIPLAGDFNGNGCDTVSIYRQSEGKVYVVNALGVDGGGLGAADFGYFFGNPGDRPFVGDFDGDGIDTVGLYRVSSGFVYFRNSNSEGAADFDFFYGDPGDVILAGDWDGDEVDTVAVYRPSAATLYLRNTNSEGNADYALKVGSYANAVVGTAPAAALGGG